MKLLTRLLLALAPSVSLFGNPADRPNILLIVADDMGFSDIGSYGAEIDTPNLDRLARNGLRFSQFYNAARCCPTRASLLTGLYPHQTGIGNMVVDQGLPAYQGDLNAQSLTVAQTLGAAGYATYMTGKWHLTKHTDMFLDWVPQERWRYVSKENWPVQRGFERFYGTIHGAGSFFSPSTLVEGNDPLPVPQGEYYYTDAISEKTVEYLDDHYTRSPARPFFFYVAYTAPHWPLHAKPRDIEKYRGRYAAGWDALRRQRFERLKELGFPGAVRELSPRDPEVPAWEDEPDKDYYERCMEVYAAQVDSMDQGIGRILAALERHGALHNTLVIFLSDNGGCAEILSEKWPRSLHLPAETRDGRPVRKGKAPGVLPGAEDTYASYGVGWANASNTPFTYYKHYIHEGGVATPLVVSWPAGVPAAMNGRWIEQVGHVKDLAPTFLELARVQHPETHAGQALTPLAGVSLARSFEGGSVEVGPVCWEHHGNRGVREGEWKLVAKAKSSWELYDLSVDRAELNDLSARHPDQVARLAAIYQSWADRVGVVENPPKPRRAE